MTSTNLIVKTRGNSEIIEHYSGPVPPIGTLMNCGNKSGTVSCVKMGITPNKTVKELIGSKIHLVEISVYLDGSEKHY
jgi:hypothetical protein